LTHAGVDASLLALPPEPLGGTMMLPPAPTVVPAVVGPVATEEVELAPPPPGPDPEEKVDPPFWLAQFGTRPATPNETRPTMEKYLEVTGDSLCRGLTMWVG
jgi:hypothetical protein